MSSASDSNGCSPAWNGVGSPDNHLTGDARPGQTFPDRALARLIDHTLLKAESTNEDVGALCKEAASHCFMSVCVNPARVARAAEALAGSGVRVCTVVGFPLGACASRVKAFETQAAIQDGAHEIDMVLDIGGAKAGDWSRVEADVRAVIDAAGEAALTKVILETCLLTPDEIRVASEVCARAGANFVKTSTGFGKAGATTDAVRIMRATVGDSLGVKASGGIRDHASAMAMIAAGASRIGASASVAIVNR